MNVRKILENYKFYDGEKRNMKLSASQVSKDILELYLAATEDPKPRVGWTRGEIGSVFHLGMEQIFKGEEAVKEGTVIQERRFSKLLPNTWEIDGKMDQVDFDQSFIEDWKGMSASAYAEFKKNSKDHRINMQMAVYNWLLNGGFTCRAHCFITDWDPVKDSHPANAYQIVECNIYTPEEIQAYMMEKTDTLAEYLAAKKTPPQCDDLMPRWVKGKTYINSKCEYYCDYSHVCKRKKDQSATKLGLNWGRS